MPKHPFVVALPHSNNVKSNAPVCARGLVVIGLQNGCGIVKPVLNESRFESDGRIAVPQDCPFRV